MIARFWKPLLGTAIVFSLVMIGGGIWSIWRDLGDGQPALVYYSVAKSDLPIVVSERGSLESQVETKIRCDVENTSYDRSGSSGTQIIFIVPNGSAVKEGDLLVELDSAPIRDRLDQQVLDHERAKSQRIQAVAKYDNQITQIETKEAQAELDVELSKLNLQMYMDDKSGTFQLAKEKVERSIDELRAEILESRANLEMARTEQAGIEALFKLGYKGKGDLDKVRFAFLRAENDLASAVNKIRNTEAEKTQLETYEFEMQKLTLKGDVATTIRALSQVVTDNKSELAQAEAAKIEAEKSEEKESERLTKLETQLELCKITAPHDGMVVYARERSRYSSGSEIAEGATVRQRQEIITLPDLSKMQVKTQVHEAVLDQIRPGLSTTVRVDAFPNRTYQGLVQEVAVVPTSSYYSNVKTYECTVQIVEEVDQLKPGMTAVVEIHVDRLQDVIAVPVQAIVQREKDTWCYVERDSGVEQRMIKLGRSNDQFVHVMDGLSLGEQLVLNPMSILEQTETTENEISPESGQETAPEVTPELEAAKAQIEQRAAKAAKMREMFKARGGMPRGKGGGGSSTRGKAGGGGRAPGKRPSNAAAQSETQESPNVKVGG